jgi:hypothetical protein
MAPPRATSRRRAGTEVAQGAAGVSRARVVTCIRTGVVDVANVPEKAIDQTNGVVRSAGSGRRSVRA